MPKISVIVPVYNSSDYLKMCLDSILNQTFSDFELILINDGSTDDSRLICEKYLKFDNRIKLINQDNSGQAAARNKGIKESAGEWLCFVDSDDCVSPNYLEYLYRAAIENNTNMSACQFVEGAKPDNLFFFKKEYSVSAFEINDNNIWSLQENYPSTYWLVWGKLILREYVIEDMFKSGRIYEDNEVAPKWLYKVKKIAIIDCPMYFYTENNNGTTKKSFSVKQLDLLWALESQIKFWYTHRYQKTQKRVLFLYMDTCDSMFNRIKTEIGISSYIRSAKKNSRKIVKEYMQNLELTLEENQKFFRFLHPFVFNIKKRLTNR